MAQVIRGRVWKFGDNVNTDVMAPWDTISQPWEEARRRVLHIRQDFVDGVRPGDVIVAGRNWGCGSSREQAAQYLKNLELAAVIAESFGRIYFRNSIAIAFPNIACPGVAGAFDDGDEIEIELETATIRNLSRVTELQGRPYTPEMLEIVQKGGLMALLKERKAAGLL
jgi:3-isopropylmalate/(R)-2-methylmalate dehydratase small subunit